VSHKIVKIFAKVVVTQFANILTFLKSVTITNEIILSFTAADVTNSVRQSSKATKIQLLTKTNKEITFHIFIEV